MSGNRRQQDRSQRRRQRRQRRVETRQQASAPRETSHVEFTGPMGFMQRHTRSFFLGGILVMVVSLGSFFFTQALRSDSTAAETVTPTPTATASATAEATSTEGAGDEIVRSYAAEPAMTIDPTHSYEAVIHLESGDVHIELLPEEAPGYVNNFVFLAENRFYDGLTFHRVDPGFVAQAGDPTGTGFGGPGYTLTEETNDLMFEPGALSMAKGGADVNGSQFFITLGDTPWLNGDFTVFGWVTEGMELLEGLAPRDPAQATEPGETIVSIEIIESDG